MPETFKLYFLIKNCLIVLFRIFKKCMLRKEGLKVEILVLQLLTYMVFVS